MIIQHAFQTIHITYRCLKVAAAWAPQPYFFRAPAAFGVQQALQHFTPAVTPPKTNMTMENHHF